METGLNFAHTSIESLKKELATQELVKQGAQTRCEVANQTSKERKTKGY